MINTHKDRDFQKLGIFNHNHNSVSEVRFPKILLILALIVFLLSSNKSSSSNNPELEMSAKLRVCYQNLGHGLKASRKLHDLMNILESRQPHVLFVSETLIDCDAIARIEASGYTIEAMPLTSERIWCAVKDGVHYKRLYEYELVDFPAIWIQIGSGKSSYIVTGLYREFTRLDNVKASRKVVNQRERFSRFLDKVELANSKNSEIHLIGDWNLNVQKWIQNGNQRPGWKFQQLVDDLHDKCINHGFVRNVDQITRISGKLKSILDFNLSNRPDMVGKMQITSDTKSDHMTLTLTRSKPDQVPPPVIEGRSWSKVDWAELKREVEENHKETLADICKIRDVDTLVERFIGWSDNLLNEKYPVKRTTFKTKYTPWMTKPVLELIKEKNAMLKKYQRTHLDVHRMAWIKMKTQASNACRKAEYEYWEKKLQDGVDPESLWESCYKYIGQKSPGAPTQVIVEGKMVNDPAEVANACQDALLDKIENNMKKIPPASTDPIDYTREYVASKNLCTFEFPTCNVTRGVGYKEVKAAIKALKNTTAAGVDQLTTKFIKMLKKPLLHILTCICNRSFEQKKYPDVYKIARVTLLCKDVKEKFNPTKYRPVSILAAPSKVLEKVAITRVINHMEQNEFFPDEAHGYRSKRSCLTAVISMHDEILRDLEAGIDSLIIMCDLSNAFDTLSYKTIIDKLRVYGFTDDSLKWYESYLHGRRQFVGLSGQKSRERRLIRGVPQGSLNGSVLFSIIFGDVVIIQVVPGLFLIIYADDLTIKVRLCGNVAVDELTINRQMNAIQLWMDANQLVFNDAKTECLLISKKVNNNVYRDLKLTMRNGEVKPQKQVRMLGLFLTYNCRNDWYIDQMPNNLIQSLNHRMYVLSKLKTACGEKQFKLLCSGILVSKVLWGVSLYSQCTEILKDKVRLILNKLVRTATNTRLIEHRRTQSMYSELKWLSFDGLQRSQDLQLLWSVMWSGQPKSLAKRINIVGNEMGGPLTRSRASQYRPTLTRDNQGISTLRREGWASRSLRFYYKMCQTEGDLVTKIIGSGEEKRKKLLKKYLMEIDFKKT